MSDLPIKGAVVKLTVAYTAALALLCATFSLTLYQVSSREFDKNAGAQRQALQRRPEFRRGLDADFIASIENDNTTSKMRLRNRIVMVNIIVMAGGAAASYVFAKRTLKPIETAHKAMIQFTADASHELRTPIAAMRAEIDVALRDKKSTKSDLTGLLKSNIEELTKITKLSERLLRLARGDALIKSSLEECEIKGIIDDAIDSVSSIGRENHTIFKNTVTDKKTIHTNRNSFKEVLIILFDNAIKYAGLGATVTCSSKLYKDRLELYVADDGPGIELDEKSKVFERFYRVNSSRGGKGHGLGLSIAKQSMENMSGEIRLDSGGDSGAVFVLTLPTR